MWMPTALYLWWIDFVDPKAVQSVDAMKKIFLKIGEKLIRLSAPRNRRMYGLNKGNKSKKIGFGM